MGAFRWAVILAGGRGTRLGALGQFMPKCLVNVFNTTILMRQIEQCAAAGVREVLVATSSMFESSVRSALALYTPPPGVAVRCAVEPAARGPILGLLSVAPALAGEAVLVLLGDEYFEHSAPFTALAAQAPAADLVVGVVHGSPPHRIHCNVVLDGAGRIRSIREKPAAHQLVGSTRWCGCVGFSAGLLDQVPRHLVEQRTHLGDLLSFMVTCGASAVPLEFDELHVNLNTTEDVLLASLAEARRQYRQHCQPLLSSIENAIATLSAGTVEETLPRRA